MAMLWYVVNRVNTRYCHLAYLGCLTSLISLRQSGHLNFHLENVAFPHCSRLDLLSLSTTHVPIIDSYGITYPITLIQLMLRANLFVLTKFLPSAAHIDI